MTRFSFRAFRFATRCPGGRGGLHQLPSTAKPAAAKREAPQCDDHPDDLRTIRHGTAVTNLQKGKACPKAGQNRRLHRSADPRRAEARTRRSASKRSFLLDRARPVSLLARPKGAPAAPRAVGRGGARERAQFSPQAETELSGLCDDDNGGRIPAGQAPLREQNPPWPPDGGPSHVTPARRSAPADNLWSRRSNPPGPPVPRNPAGESRPHSSGKTSA